MVNGDNSPASRYEFEVIGRKEPGPVKKFLLQILRFALAGIFLYIAYLGFTLRSAPSPPKTQAPPANEAAPTAGKRF